jgi:hypothetical protein
MISKMTDLLKFPRNSTKNIMDCKMIRSNFHLSLLVDSFSAFGLENFHPKQFKIVSLFYPVLFIMLSWGPFLNPPEVRFYVFIFVHF